MGEFLCIMGVAFLIAILISIAIIKRELDKDKMEKLKKQVEVSKRLSDQATLEALKLTEEEEEDEEEDEDEY